VANLGRDWHPRAACVEWGVRSGGGDPGPAEEILPGVAVPGRVRVHFPEDHFIFREAVG
jgi:hypothetical protein